jgi:hypothetical protein
LRRRRFSDVRRRLTAVSDNAAAAAAAQFALAQRSATENRMSAPVRLSFLLLAAFVASGPVSAADEAPHERQAKQAVDDRADTRIRSDDVGKGTHYARKPLGTGAYFNDGSREAVRRYYAAHPAQAVGARPRWEVGETLPAGAAAGAVPAPLLGKLP